MLQNYMVDMVEELEKRRVTVCKNCGLEIYDGDFFYSIEIEGISHDFCEGCINDSRMEAEGYIPY